MLKSFFFIDAIFGDIWCASIWTLIEKESLSINKLEQLLIEKVCLLFETWGLTLRHHTCTTLHDDVSPRAVGSLLTESPSRARERTYI